MKNDFTKIYDEYKPLIMIFLHNKVRLQEDREEICNDVFSHMFTAIQNGNGYNPKHDSKAKFTTWLHTIAKNLVIDYNRKNTANGQTCTLPTSDLVNKNGDVSFEFISRQKSENVIENKELHRNIRRAIRTLKPQEKQIAILRLVKEYEYNEIAEMLDIPLNNVKVIVFRAKEKLQKVLRTDYALVG